MSFTNVLKYGLVSQGDIFNPIDIGGLIVWGGDYVNGGTLRTSLSNGTNITQWDDLSGLNHHLLSSTTYPIYNSADASIYVNAGSKYLKTAATALSVAVGYQTMFMVLKTSSTATYYSMIRTGSDVHYSYTYSLGASTENKDATGKNSFNASIGANWLATGSYVLITKRMNKLNATHIIRRNGVTLARGTLYHTQNLNDTKLTGWFSIGSGTTSGNPNAYWKEVLLYDKSISDTEMEAVEAYLNAKYSIY